MPAAAVSPAPIAYIKVVAVKKLVVGFLVLRLCPSVAARPLRDWSRMPSFQRVVLPFTGPGLQSGSFTLKKLECLKQAFCLEYISME